MKHSHLGREIIEVAALIVVVIIVVHFLIQSYSVVDGDMQPALKQGQSVLVNKMAYLFHAPERGDVIAFHYPQDTTRDYIKRVIAIPGDTIEFDRNRVLVNGVILKESYISNPGNPMSWACNTSVGAITATRCIKFSSSRTLPGQV